MNYLNVNLRSDLNAEQTNQVLEKVRSQAGVEDVSHINAESPNPILQKMFFAKLNKEADPQQIQELLSQIPGVLQVTLPSKRKLV